MALPMRTMVAPSAMAAALAMAPPAAERDALTGLLTAPVTRTTSEHR